MTATKRYRRVRHCLDAMASRVLPGRLHTDRAAAVLGLATAAILALPASAASLNFVLDQSNSLPDGRDYMAVAVADGTDNAIDFRVTPLEPLTGGRRHRFGIKLFAFNVADGSSATSANVSGLPDGWRAFDNKRADGFGRFDIVVTGPGWARQEELTFSITGIDGDTPADYAEESGGRARQGNEFFAASLKGFTLRKPRFGDHHGDDDWSTARPIADSRSFGGEWGDAPALDWLLSSPDCWEGGRLVKLGKLRKALLHLLHHATHERSSRQAFVGGSTVVPVPAALWLLASALAGLVGFRRRLNTAGAANTG